MAATRRTFLAASARLSVAALIPALHARADEARGGNRIRIGQIGTAHAHAGGKMQTMRKLSHLYEVVGVVEPNPERRGKQAESAPYRGLPLLTEDQLFAVPGLQAVTVETAVRDLVPTARRCIEAGLHVHLDKPAGESLSAFRSLLEAAKRQKRVVQMGYMFRYNPAFQFCFRAVKEGWLGKVFAVDGSIGKKLDLESRAGLAEYEGGTMFELGCHLIDAVVSVLGKPDDVAPFAHRSMPGRDNLADNQLAVFRYPQASAVIRSVLIDPHGGPRRHFTVAGDQGTIEIRPLEPPRLSLSLATARGEFARGTQLVELPRMSGRYDGEFIDLAAIIRGEKQPDYSPAHDLAVHEAVLLASGVPAE